MSLVFFPNYKATQDRIASIKESFRAAAQWTGDAVQEKPVSILLIKPAMREDDFAPVKKRHGA